MSRAEVIQIRCDRCKRVELLPPAPKKTLPDFEARFGDKKLLYEDICSRCRETINSAWKELVEWNRPSAQQFGPTVSANEAAPLVSAPDYSPPKPHSAASTTKR